MSELTILTAAFLGFVLLYASFSKSRQLSVFASQIASFRIPLFRSAFTSYAAWLTVLAEALLGVALLIIPQSHYVALAAMAFFLFMLALIVFVWASKRKVPCFCFGEEDGAVGVITICRNLVLASLACSYGSSVTGGIQQSATWGVDRLLLLVYSMSAMLAFLSALRLISLERELGMSVQ